MQRYVRGKQLVKLYDYICVGCGKRKKSKAGNKRKAKLRNNGTTPTAAQLFGDEE